MTERNCSVPGCGTPIHARGLCQAHYCRQKRGAAPEAPYRRRILNDHNARFDLSVEMDPNGGCWLWSGATSEFGHGRFSVRHRQLPAHRFAYERAKGPIPIGLNVCHRCDVPQCVNPDHLFAGTQADNIADMMAKGRYGDDRRWSRGSAHPHAKLDERAVQRILSALSRGQSQYDIADQYGVSQVMVSRIKRGLAWAHVPRIAA